MINKTLLNWINTESNLHLWVVISSVYLLFSRDAGVFDPWPGLPTHPISSLSRQEENTASHSKSGLLFRTEVECNVVLKVPSGALSQSQKSRAPFMHPRRLVLTCPLSLQGLGLRDELASRGYKEEKRGSHGAEEFQEQKEGRSSKDSRCSQLLTEPLIQLLRTECFMGQPDHEEEDKASWLTGSWLDLHLALSPGRLRCKIVSQNYRQTFPATWLEALSHLVE